VLDYREPLILEKFSSGNAAFARNWFYQVGQLNKDPLLAGKFGIAPLPGKNGIGVGTIGGWGLGINKNSTLRNRSMEFIMKAESLQQQHTMFLNQGFIPVLAEYLGNETNICNEYSRTFKYVKPCCYLNATDLLSQLNNGTCKNEPQGVCPLEGSKYGVDWGNYLVSRPSKPAGLKYPMISKIFYSTVTDILTKRIAPKEGVLNMECKMSKMLGKNVGRCIPCEISTPLIVKIDEGTNIILMCYSYL
jgi:ABC-type glycerol-3-phosphate transport system substrate-binding protein